MTYDSGLRLDFQESRVAPGQTHAGLRCRLRSAALSCGLDYGGVCMGTGFDLNTDKAAM